MQDTYLIVTGLLHGEELQRVALPDVGVLCRPQDLLWSVDCETVVVRFGDEWALESWQRNRWDVRTGDAGLVFVSLCTSMCQTVELPSQERLILAGHPLQCAWSCSTGCLALLHVDAEQQLTLSAFSSAGDLLVSTAAPDVGEPQVNNKLRPCRLCWSPNAQRLAYHLPGSTALCLWQPFVSLDDQCVELSLGVQESDGALVWSPCSAAVLVHFDGLTSVICSLDGQLVQQPPLQHTQHSIAWGLSGGVSIGNDSAIGQFCRISTILPGCKELSWRPVQQGHLLGPPRIMDLRPRLLTPPSAVSPDGQHIAVIAWRHQRSWTEPDFLTEPCLLVASVASGCMIQHPVLPLAKKPKAFNLRWAPDESKLVCSAEAGVQHLILSFDC